jgi:hypothetical protein
MIKTGDKIICIEDSFLPIKYSYVRFLTKGNLYEVEDVYDNTFWVKTDDVLRVFKIVNFKNYFITLAEWREKQINSILDD